LIALGKVEMPVCQKCNEINRRIGDLQHARSAADDPLAISLLGMAIDELESDKVALHPPKSADD
jgi:hypothetical protein